MSEALETQNSLLDRLPKVRGRYSENALLSRVTWFQVGGPADVLYKPADLEDLQDFLRNKPKDIPVIVLGVGSNLLVRDGGVRGVVIRLGGAFADISVEGTRITAGAAALDLNVARTAARAHVEGLEFLSGIPGTIGGALRMNAGAYGGETKDILKRAWAVTPEGELKELNLSDMGFSYRKSAIPSDWIFVKAEFEGCSGQEQEIRDRMEDIQTKRAETQPIKSRTGGSTFKNPEGHSSWKLIDEAGGRGLTIGGAQMSNQHCNFMINTGTATAKDLENLGEEVRQLVKNHSNVELQWEIKRIGDKEVTSFTSGKDE
ncbi:UDP-N-acetylmuramate dehydrogenase [Curvivirga aplysinae]|uniref:UDP-N-acetylmuramate dehydrogenase n=1 Tax=Curvivirga aplysinae TaxID=2529852 RepID=UPI0012BD3A7E|nr:UDP-N-acetylmuramate dehydrogenase [Curvivirga aplysinae]MTI10779.1 UDP-N-acetylmuramate dehydrogenase [Curvivirga aplysinae]